MDFVAIDFETANRHWHSACEIGLVVVEQGQIVDRYRRLIRPTPNEFDRGNIRVHNITPEQVMHEATFAEIYDELLPYLADRTIVAHNASFDIGVLRASIDHYALPHCSLKYACTVQLAKRVWPEAGRHGLRSISDFLGIQLDHHQALSDASASAQIVLAAQRLLEANDFDSMLQEIGLSSRDYKDYGKSSKARSWRSPLWSSDGNPALTSPSAPNRRFLRKKPSGERIHNWPSRFGIPDPFASDAGSATDFLKDKCFAFTGELEGCSREEVRELVESREGKYTDTVNIKIDYLVVGRESWINPSRKLIKAQNLLDMGATLKIINEEEFWQMLGETATRG